MGDDTVTIKAKHRDEEGKLVVEKIPVHAHNSDTVKHVEKKLADQGVQRLDRHSGSVKGSVKKPPPKKGHGGKYTWEGPNPEADNELEAVTALDEGDPNYVDDEDEVVHDEEVVKERVKGQVEVAKMDEDKEGVGRVEVHPHLNTN